MEHELREALEVCRQEIVLTIAFLGRDAGTARLPKTIDDLIARLVLADAAAQRALSNPPAEPKSDLREGVARAMRKAMIEYPYLAKASERHSAGEKLIAAATDAILALVSTREGEGWRPIETAPRDDVFLAWSAPLVRLCRWSTDLVRKQPGWEYLDHRRGKSPRAWGKRKPTHWQPLPSPPMKEGGE